jgi:hypothetical protein
MMRYSLEQCLLLYNTSWNTDLPESVGENFNENFMMKEFPADKQFTIWWINLDQRDF